MPLDSSARQTRQPDAFVTFAAAGFIDGYKLHSGKLAEAFGYAEEAIEDFSEQIVRAGLQKHISEDYLGALLDYIRENGDIPAGAKLILSAEVADTLPEAPYTDGQQIVIGITRDMVKVAGVGDVEMQLTANGTSMTSNRASIEDIFRTHKEETFFITAYIPTRNELDGIKAQQQAAMAAVAAAIESAAAPADLNALMEDMQQAGVSADVMQMAINLVELRSLADAPATPQITARIAELGQAITAQLTQAPQAGIPAVIAQAVQMTLIDTITQQNLGHVIPVESLQVTQSAIAVQAVIEQLDSVAETMPAEARAELAAMIETLAAADVEAVPAQLDTIKNHIADTASPDAAGAQIPAIEAVQASIVAEIAHQDRATAQAAQDITAAVQELAQVQNNLPAELGAAVEKLDAAGVTAEMVAEAIAPQNESLKNEAPQTDAAQPAEAVSAGIAENAETPASPAKPEQAGGEIKAAATDMTAEAQAMIAETQATAIETQDMTAGAAKPAETVAAADNAQPAQAEIGTGQPKAETLAAVRTVVAALAQPSVRASLPPAPQAAAQRIFASPAPAVAAIVVQAARQTPAQAAHAVPAPAAVKPSSIAAVPPAANNNAARAPVQPSTFTKAPPVTAAVAQLDAIAKQPAIAKNPQTAQLVENVRQSLEEKGHVPPALQRKVDDAIKAIPPGPARNEIQRVVESYKQQPAPIAPVQAAALQAIVTRLDNAAPGQHKDTPREAVRDIVKETIRAGEITPMQAEALREIIRENPGIARAMPDEFKMLETTFADAGHPIGAKPPEHSDVSFQCGSGHCGPCTKCKDAFDSMAINAARQEMAGYGDNIHIDADSFDMLSSHKTAAQPRPQAA